MKHIVEVFSEVPSMDVYEGLKDGKYMVTVAKYRRQKSNQQLGYLWGGIYPYLAQEAGYIYPGMSSHDIREAINGVEGDRTKPGLHRQLCAMCGPDVFIVGMDGEEVRVDFRLSEADEGVAGKYIDNIIKKFADYNIPPPTSPHAMKFWDEMIKTYNYQ